MLSLSGGKSLLNHGEPQNGLSQRHIVTCAHKMDASHAVTATVFLPNHFLCRVGPPELQHLAVCDIVHNVPN